jgi:ATP-grasp domain
MKVDASLFDLVRSHAFIHDDSILDAPFDEYSMHPCLLGARVVVTNTARFCGDRYISSMRELGAWPDTIIEPRETSLSPLANLIEDNDALERLVVTMRDGGLDLSTFYHDTKELPQLLKLLSKRGIVPAVRPNGRLPEECVTRSDAMALLKRFNVPTPTGFVCRTEVEMLEATVKLGRAVVKQDVGTPFKISVGAAYPQSLSYPVYVEECIEVRSSPNIQWMSAQGLSGLMVSEQIVREFRHVGNRSVDCRNIIGQIKNIENKIENMCRDYQYEGPIGLDAVLDCNEKIYIVDINPRFNSCTYPTYFKNVILGIPSADFVYECVEFRANLLDDICFSQSFLQFDKDSCGSILFGPVAESVGGVARGGFLLSLAHGMGTAYDIHSRNLSVIRSLK